MCKNVAEGDISDSDREKKRGVVEKKIAVMVKNYINWYHSLKMTINSIHVFI